MMYWSLIPGSNLPFLWRLAPGLLLLGFLVSGLGFYLLAMKVRKIVKKRRARGEQTPMTEPIPFVSRMERMSRSVNKPTLLLLGIVLGGSIAGPAGWFWRGHSYDYAKEYALWKLQIADYQKAYAAWDARQPHKENK